MCDNFKEWLSVELKSIQLYDANYLQQYILFIVDIEQQDKSLYGEHHHILPKSLFPQHKFNKLNLKYISAKNHFVAHYLLYKAYPHNKKMIAAFKFMFDMYKQIDNDDMLNKYAQEYEQARMVLNETNKGENHFNYGRVASEETRKKLSKAALGNKSTSGQKRSAESRQKQSMATKRRPSHRRGKKLPDETRAKMSKGQLGRKHSVESNTKQAQVRIGKKTKNNKSGFVGVRFNKQANKWVARITINGKRKHLGRFNTPEEASEAYQAALQQYKNSQNITHTE